MGMKKEQCQYCKYRNLTLSLFPLLILLIPLSFVGLLIDGWYDSNLCYREFKEVEPDAYYIDVYANADFWKYNFGKEIGCAVFWHEDDTGYLTSVYFKAGTLIEDRVESARYWRD